MKTNNEIIEELARNKIIEEIVYKIGKEEEPNNLNDLIQDLYLELLQKNNEKLNNLYQTNQLHYFITRMVINNIRSKNSRYYYIYKKNNQRFVTDYTENLDEENEY